MNMVYTPRRYGVTTYEKELKAAQQKQLARRVVLVASVGLNVILAALWILR